MSKRPFQLDANVYEAMLKMLNDLYFADCIGKKMDMDFISEDDWLSDTAVIENVIRRKGTWEIHLLFAHHQQPLKFLSRLITSHPCPKRAAIMAVYMRRLAAKDQRGTLKIAPDLLKIPYN